jgi:hypothetical protein
MTGLRRRARARCYPVAKAAKKQRKRAYNPPTPEVVNPRERTESTRTHRTTATAPRAGRAQARGQQEYPTPSWGRTLRRLPIYMALIFFMQFYLLGKEDGMDTGKRLVAAAGFAIVITIVFAPFMHAMDRMAYNRHLKRTANGK